MPCSFVRLLCLVMKEGQRSNCVCVCVFFRENLERLLDDKHFKEEMVHFNISEETGVVDASHRAKLIPLLMR